VTDWRCERCGAAPLDLEPGLSPDMALGVCSNYQCPTRAPVRVKLKGGGFASKVGRGTFRRKT
jgi:hypothetical protein